MHILVSEPFPEVHHIAFVCKRDHFLVSYSFTDTRDELVKIRVYLIHPSLLMTLPRSHRIDLCTHAHHSAYDSRLRLCSGHSTQSGCHEQHALHVLLSVLKTTRLELLACCIHHGDGCPMNYSLRTYIHIRSCSHLSVLRHSERIELLPMVRLRVVRDHHTVGDYHPWCVLMARKQPQRMSGIHYKSLLVSHLGQILHHKTVLCPVLEHGSVASIGDQFMRVLCHTIVQIVLDHRHYGSRLR